LSLRIFLIVAGLHGFAFTIFMQKPPGPYFFVCAVLMIAVLGSVLSGDKRPGLAKVVVAMIVATAAQQLVIGFLAAEKSRLWLTLQFLALQILMIGVMLTRKRSDG
jgi:hypothetical protein